VSRIELSGAMIRELGHLRGMEGLRTARVLARRSVDG
jgi:hypothetical protein